MNVKKFGNIYTVNFLYYLKTYQDKEMFSKSSFFMHLCKQNIWGFPATSQVE